MQQTIRPAWFRTLWDYQPAAWIIADPDAWIATVERHFGGLDLLKCAEDAVSWLRENPRRRRSQLRKFFNGWLRKETDIQRYGYSRRPRPKRAQGTSQRSDAFIAAYRRRQAARGAL